eukprot:NODE_23_length_3333_cov_275.354750_g19_i0.p2 GENE.NODE_23_length_3333_cov_275.354750_g19_i0~~NODE_23_length_3333_cov_275.354750_g19_i0.p2  ORF type:complete len:252 (+),score=-45.03 NODE_23_length_3333_cov_275.354750_g19_i0:64-819(+)
MQDLENALNDIETNLYTTSRLDRTFSTSIFVVSSNCCLYLPKYHAYFEPITLENLKTRVAGPERLTSIIVSDDHTFQNKAPFNKCFLVKSFSHLQKPSSSDVVSKINTCHLKSSIPTFGVFVSAQSRHGTILIHQTGVAIPNTPENLDRLDMTKSYIFSNVPKISRRNSFLLDRDLAITLFCNHTFNHSKCEAFANAHVKSDGNLMDALNYAMIQRKSLQSVSSTTNTSIQDLIEIMKASNPAMLKKLKFF